MEEIKDSQFLNKINSNLEKQLSKEFLKKNPLICGGYLYASLLMYHKDFSKLYFDKNFYTKRDKKRFIINDDIGYELAEDIDVFLLEDNHNFDIVLDKLNDDKFTFSKRFLSESLSINLDTIKNYYHSKFALSFNRKFSSLQNLKKIQIIRKKSKSKEDLVNSFDLHNCSLVWQDGRVYATKECIESILSKEINYNENYSIPETYFDHVFQANRIFKYWIRYGKFSSISQSSHNRLLNLYIELSQNHFVQAKDISNCKFVKTRYGGYMDSKMENLLNVFLHNFSYFIHNSELVQESDLLYLIASDVKEIQDTVKYLIADEPRGFPCLF